LDSSDLLRGALFVLGLLLELLDESVEGLLYTKGKILVLLTGINENKIES